MGELGDMIQLPLKTRFLNSLREVLRLARVESLLAKFTYKQSPDSILVKSLPNHYQYPEFAFKPITQDGIKYRLNLGDWIGWNAYFGVTTNADKQLYSLAKPGDTVIDIGSNIGYMLLKFARLVSNKGQVIGFEPDPECYAQCLNNISLNNFTNIQIFNLALAHRNDELLLSTSKERNRGGNSITSDPNETTKVKAVTLDHFVLSNNINTVDLIKIDVEGFEMNVLFGALQTLKEKRPKLFVEINNDHLLKQGSSARQVITWIANLNYQIRSAETGERIDPVEGYEHCHFDIVCIPDQK